MLAFTLSNGGAGPQRSQLIDNPSPKIHAPSIGRLGLGEPVGNMDFRALITSAELLVSAWDVQIGRPKLRRDPCVNKSDSPHATQF